MPRSLYQILLEKLALAGERVIEMLSEELAVMAVRWRTECA